MPASAPAAASAAAGVASPKSINAGGAVVAAGCAATGWATPLATGLVSPVASSRAMTAARRDTTAASDEAAAGGAALSPPRSSACTSSCEAEAASRPTKAAIGS